MKDVRKQKIREIRIEKINNKSDKETFYWIYAHVDNKIKILAEAPLNLKLLATIA